MYCTTAFFLGRIYKKKNHKPPAKLQRVRSTFLRLIFFFFLWPTYKNKQISFPLYLEKCLYINLKWGKKNLQFPCEQANFLSSGSFISLQYFKALCLWKFFFFNAATVGKCNADKNEIWDWRFCLVTFYRSQISSAVSLWSRNSLASANAKSPHTL